MSDLFSDLEKFGFRDLSQVTIYQETKEKLVSQKQKTKEMNIKEEDLIFDKSYKCPACDSDFKSKAVRTGKAKLIHTDWDLRPKYGHIDSLKYDAVLCPCCGYAALGRFFQYLSAAQRKYVREKICVNYNKPPYEGSFYTYEESINRHKLALLSTIVKNGKASEKAYTCLKIAWLYRGYGEELAENEKSDQEEIKKAQQFEIEFLKKAYEGFNSAYSAETFPMCGMDEYTVMYLVAALGYRTGDTEGSLRGISRLLSTRGVNDRIKNKARELKDEIKLAVNEAEA